MPAGDRTLQAAVAARVLAGAPVAGDLRVPVRGTSMVPTLADGDVVTVRAGGAFAVGDVVVVRNATGLIVHRVVDRARDHVVTRGDARFAPDPPVELAAVLGRVDRAAPLPGRSRRARVAAWLPVAACGAAVRLDPAAGAWIARRLTGIERGPLVARLIAWFGRSRWRR